jgi:hypothetical protein
MCVLSATQVLASAIKKTGRKQAISLQQLIKYNELLLKSFPDYYNTINLDDLSFEIGSVATEFEITINEKYEREIKLVRNASFDYSLYENTMPDGIAERLAEIELP